MRAARICRAALNSRFAYLFTLTLRRFTLTLRRPCKNKSAATHILASTSHAFAYSCRRLSSARRPRKQKRRSSCRNAHTHFRLSCLCLCVPLPPAVFSAARAKTKAPQLAPQRSVLLRGFGTASAAARLACNRSVRCRLRACPSRRTLRWWVLHRRRAPRPAPTHIRATRRIPTAAHIGARQSLSLCYHNPLMFASISRLFCD